MAEAIVVHVVGNIIQALSSPALQRIGASWGVKDELDKLKHTVTTLEAVLADAGERYYYSDPVNVWLRRMKDAVCEAQDLLDEFSVEAIRLQLRSRNKILDPIRTFFSGSNQIVFRLKMSPRVRAVRERIESVAADRRLHLEERLLHAPGQMELRRNELAHSFIHEDDIIGRDDDKKAILGFLLDSREGENLSVLSVVGIAGVGKTALAQYVYQDKMVEKHFDLKIWVCVSDVFDVKRIIRSIITSNGGEENMCKHEPIADMNQLQQQLHKKLVGRKYLIVLDDMWNEDRERWINLKSLLSTGAGGSKILITTRTDVVAEITSTMPPYHLRILSESTSCDLFMRMAFKDGKNTKDPEFMTIGKKIAEKCSGVPLALRAMGSLMLFKKSKAEWLHVLDHELVRMGPHKASVMPIVELSYHYLPSHLKQCFSYCSLFPKDFTIKKITLINLWIAHGLIKVPEWNPDIEDVAEEYFLNLLWRNFFQDVDVDSYGNIRSCRMHDLMNDLAQSVSGIESALLSGHEEKVYQSTYHVSFSTTAEIAEALPDLSHKARNLRTIFSTASPWYESGFGMSTPATFTVKAILDQITMKFRSLRVLDLHDMNIEHVPSSIGKLIHLTYLDLSGNTKLRRLPSSIVKLHKLLVLNLRWCRELEELPRNLRLLPSLRFLDIKFCHKLQFLPRGLRKLTSFSTLTTFILANTSRYGRNYSHLSDLNGLDNLRGELMIINLPHDAKAALDAKDAELRKKQRLHTLGLAWQSLQGDEPDAAINDGTILEVLQPHTGIRCLIISGFSGRRFQCWMMNNTWESLPNLIEMHIKNCTRCEWLPPLGQLPCLKFLELRNLPEVEYIEGIICAPADDSKTREGLATHSARAGPLGWHQPSSSSSFPCLTELWIEDCPKLKFIPFCSNLDKLRIGKVGLELLKQSFQFRMLKCLHIRNIDEMKYVPEEWLQNLGSLERLYIEKCPNMTCLSRGIKRLTGLQKLWIRDCEQLDLSLDENGEPMKLEGLKNMHDLTIRKVPKMVTLPDWLLDLFNLNSLSIVNCSQLMALPEWIGEIRSLRRLDVVRCPGLTSLPESIRQLMSLEVVRIAGCPKLEGAYERAAAKDWYKVAHVPQYLTNFYSNEEEDREDVDFIFFGYVLVQSCPTLITGSSSYFLSPLWHQLLHLCSGEWLSCF